MERDLQEKREYLENQIPRENRVNLKRLTDRKKKTSSKYEEILAER